MFFIMGISQGEKKLDVNQTIVCRSCGKYGRIEAYMVYSYLSLFFIPVLKWNRRYFVKTSCCSTMVPISNELGEQLRRGEHTYIPEDIIPDTWQGQQIKHCARCGYETEENFQYCPKCGEEF